MRFSNRLRTTVAMLLAGLFPLAALAQPLTFDRATTCASGAGDYGWGPSTVVVDAQGNTYVAGTFNGVIALGNALLSATQTYAGNTMPSDNFIAKLDPAGNYLWAVQLGDNQSAVIGGLTVDGAGDVYLTGAFSSFSLRVGAGGPQLFNSSADNEAFIAKFNGNTGQARWARRAGGTNFDAAGRVAINTAGDVYVEISSSSAVVDFGAFTFTNSRNYAAFLAKLSPSGVWQWVRPIGNGTLGISALLFDAQGDLYLAGSFVPPAVTFGTTTLTTQFVPGAPTTSAGDVFVAKTTEAGTWLWATQGDAVTHQNMVRGGQLALDGNGYLYTAGSYASTSARIGAAVLPNLSNQYAQPNPLPPVPYTNHYYTDAFVARLNATTGAWEWAVRNGGPYFENAGTPVVDPNGALYVLGSFNSPTPAGTDQQLAQLRAATGAWGPINSLAPAFARGLALDQQRRLHLAGTFSSATATLGSFTLAQNGPGQATGFLARLAALPLAGRAASQRPAALAVWPNPVAGGLVQVQGPPPGHPVQVLDVLGRTVATGRMPATGPLGLVLPAAVAAGLYVVRSGEQARQLVVE